MARFVRGPRTMYVMLLSGRDSRRFKAISIADFVVVTKLDLK
jgi:hypothetical protein